MQVNQQKPLCNAFGIVVVHGHPARSIHQTTQWRGRKTGDEVETCHDELLDYEHTQLDGYIPIDDVERAVINKVCENTVENTDGKEGKRGKDRV